VDERGKFILPGRVWELREGEDGERAKFSELEVVWYWSMMEGEAEVHEGCQGPECSCWRKKKP